MKHKIIYSLFSLSTILLNLVYSQITFLEKSRFYFTENPVIQKFKADYLVNNIENSFLVLDKDLGSIHKFEISKDAFKSIDYYNISESFGDLIGVIANSSGILIFDRNNNQIFKLDYNLNLITIDILDIQLYPEKVAIDTWGRPIIYSKRLNAIFIYENHIDGKILINLNHIPNFNNCISDFEVGSNGDIAILDCTGEVYLFNSLGKLRFSYPPVLEKSKFLIYYNSNWIILNEKGLGTNLNDRSKIIFPETNLKLKDISVVDNNIVLLYNSFISVLHVQN